MITIRPTLPPGTVRHLIDLNGEFYLDTPPGLELRLTKTIDKIGELGRITQEAALSVTLPYTSRNRAFFASYEPDALVRSSGRFAVEVTQDGDRQPLTAASVTQSSGGYELELFGDDWLQGLEDLPLNTADLGTFEWTRANILSAWGTGRTTPFALPGLASYGGWTQPGTVTLRDLRMWFNLGELLRQLLCSIGWNFVSPHFDEGDGRYWYAYLSGLRWHTYRTKKAEQYVEVSTAAQALDGTIADRPIWTVDEDAQTRWLTFGRQSWPTFTYLHVPGDPPEPVLLTIEAEFEVTLPPGPGAEVPNFYVAIIQYNHRSITPIEIFRETYTGGTTTPRTVTVTISEYIEATIPEYINRDSQEPTDTYLPRFELVFGYETSSGPVPFTLDSAVVRFRPDPRYYYEGDLLTLGDLLDSDLNGKDLIEAAAHLINGKVVTDYAKREVTLYAPTDYARVEDGQNVAGFYVSRPVDLRQLTVPDSLNWEDAQDKKPQYRAYDFADNGDTIVERDGRDRFRRRVDLGRGTGQKPAEYKNPLFGPTLGINVPPSIVAGTGIFLPALHDNEDGNITHDPGPRIAVWYGQVAQGDPEAVNVWSFDNTQQETVPVLLMLPDAGIGEDRDPEPLTFNGYATDLYNRHYRDEVEDSGPVVSVLLAGGDATYDAITFRNTLLIKGLNGDYELQPAAVRDHARGSSIALLVEGKNKRC